MQMKPVSVLFVGLILLLGGCPGRGQAQMYLSSLTEIQLGNLPDNEPQDLRTIYYQLNLDYTLSGFRMGLRSENFRATESGRNYHQFAQRYAQYRRGQLHATAGHFYTIIGNGLLVHAFELPGVITEDRGSRRRYQITRDLDGLQVGYSWKGARILLLRGTPVNSGLPPGLEGVDRRDGTVQGGAVEVRPWRSVEGGIGLLQLKAAGEEELGATVYVNLRLAPVLERLNLQDLHVDLSGEYAQRDAKADRWFSLDRDLPRALYLAGTLTAGSLGLSLEYKDYRDFLLSEVNNPPTLIREHEAFLLNRDTHELLADDEQGVQAELTYGFEGGQTLIAHMARARRRQEPGEEDDLNLWEFFVQANSPVGQSVHAQVFADHSRDRFFTDERRTTLGSAWDWRVSEGYALNADVQFQHVSRRLGRSELPFKNVYLGMELSRAPGWSWALLLQRSTDILERGASSTGTTYWWGSNINWQIREGYNLHLFGGKRRSGLACAAGTCYEVLGFEGVELRLINQL